MKFGHPGASARAVKLARSLEVLLAHLGYAFAGTFETLHETAVREGEDLGNSEQRQSRRGFLNPSLVRSISFWITSICILVAVVASLLAIWKFAGTDILWRTVATCAVIGSGTVAFYWVNVLFGNTSD